MTYDLIVTVTELQQNVMYDALKRFKKNSLHKDDP